MKTRALASLVIAVAVIAVARVHSAAAPLHSPWPTSHPRLWVRASDLPRLRGWATQKNPLWPAITQLAEKLRAEMDAGRLTRGPGCKDEREQHVCEQAGELFAFMSLVSSDARAQSDYAARARTILMKIIDAAANGPAGDEIRAPRFAVNDRSRWSGEAVPLIVDWVYPTLSADDKRKIRSVFLTWADELQHAEVTTDNHPEPIGAVDDPALVADKQRLRWASNNYFTAHARNLGLMALALDERDDPDGKLRGYLPIAGKSWLYMVGALLRGDMRGGLAADGHEYGPQSLAYVTQLLLAMHTARMESGDVVDPRVLLSAERFWSDAVDGWLAVQSPGTFPNPWLNTETHQPAWWADGQHDVTPESIDLFAPMALYDLDTKNAARAEKIRWLQEFLLPRQLEARVAGADQYRQAILYFLLYDPNAPEPRDPRPSLPTTFFAPGIGRLLARTDWTPKASWLAYGCGWENIDHQHGDAGSFDLYRNGEWLTKERTGYGTTASTSEWHNTLSIENNRGRHSVDPGDYRTQLWRTGSQWTYATGGDPRLVAHVETARHVYASCDATAAYNAPNEGAGDVETATRQLLWIVPDTVVVLDRAATKTQARFKRFALQFATLPKISGTRALVKTPHGQQLTVTTLLPADARPTAAQLAKSDEADFDPITARLTVESRAQDVRFLHVLRANSGDQSAQLVDARDDWVAVRAGDTIAVFVTRAGVDGIDFAAPAGIKRVVAAGLAPNQPYSVSLSSPGRVHITKGGDRRADDGGVVWLAPAK
jgi:hypothetical protein